MQWKTNLPKLLSVLEQKELAFRLRNAQDEYMTAKEAVSNAVEEIDRLPDTEVHHSIRQALRRERRAVHRVAELLAEFSESLLKESGKAPSGDSTPASPQSTDLQMRNEPR